MIIVGLEFDRQEESAPMTAREQIAQACSNYALGLDQRDLERYLSAWHSDATCTRADTVYAGREGLIEWAENVWSRYRWTSHLVGNLSVSDVTDGGALCVSATQAMLVRADGELLLAGAHYEDVFASRDGVWRIAERLMVAGSFAHLAGAEITVGWGGAAGS
jgi:SnoaL-like domain